jgi:translocation and assembly module TamA
VTVRSQAGPKVKIEELVIEGIDPEDARAVAARFPGTLSRVELATAQPGAQSRLLDALRILGWPEARIAGQVLDERRLAMRVEPGPRQVLGEIDMAGVEGDEAGRLRDLVKVRSGEPARQARLAQGALALEVDLRSRGYADATARPVLHPREGSPQVVDVTYEVSPGRRYQVAGVEITGERWTSPGLLDRVVDLSPGELLDAAALDRARQEIFGLGVFSRVTADVEKGEDGSAQVSFSLTEKPRFRFGYGVRSESGEGTGAVVDFVDSNFLGRAMTLGLRGLYKDKDRSARLYLQTGGLLGTPISFETFLQVRRRLPEEGLVEDREELSLQLARPFGRRFTGRLYGRYRTSRTVVTFDPSTPPFDIELSIPLVGTQLLYDSRNDLFDPTSGLFASLDLSGSGNWLGSDFDFARAFGQVSDFRRITLAGRPLLWAQGVRLGVAQAFRDQDVVPQERFFAGGEFSVRGYETEFLGPLEILGDFVQALGGSALLVINEELRVPLPFDLTGLVFFDAGQVWADTGDFGTDLAKSVGLGLRAKSPIGLLRFDAAYPLDRREGDARYKLYFGFGNTF